MKQYAPNKCEPNIEVIMKMGVQWGGVGSGFLGCQGGCEREGRIEVIMKSKKTSSPKGNNRSPDSMSSKYFE